MRVTTSGQRNCSQDGNRRSFSRRRVCRTFLYYAKPETTLALASSLTLLALGLFATNNILRAGKARGPPSAMTG